MRSWGNVKSIQPETLQQARHIACAGRPNRIVRDQQDKLFTSGVPEDSKALRY
jgi:hypothetical protein